MKEKKARFFLVPIHRSGYQFLSGGCQRIHPSLVCRHSVYTPRSLAVKGQHMATPLLELFNQPERKTRLFRDDNFEPRSRDKEVLAPNCGLKYMVDLQWFRTRDSTRAFRSTLGNWKE
ncbi:hypothetical protein TNCV_3350061 [Trichonephila clavipes]|nr:hypothetical protein TNCV_3350061 [Trichonephila clavipes]